MYTCWFLKQFIFYLKIYFFIVFMQETSRWSTSFCTLWAMYFKVSYLYYFMLSNKSHSNLLKAKREGRELRCQNLKFCVIYWLWIGLSNMSHNYLNHTSSLMSALQVHVTCFPLDKGQYIWVKVSQTLPRLLPPLSLWLIQRWSQFNGKLITQGHYL